MGPWFNLRSSDTSASSATSSSHILFSRMFFPLNRVGVAKQWLFPAKIFDTSSASHEVWSKVGWGVYFWLLINAKCCNLKILFTILFATVSPEQVRRRISSPWTTRFWAFYEKYLFQFYYFVFFFFFYSKRIYILATIIHYIFNWKNCQLILFTTSIPQPLAVGRTPPVSAHGYAPDQGGRLVWHSARIFMWSYHPCYEELSNLCAVNLDPSFRSNRCRI